MGSVPRILTPRAIKQAAQAFVELNDGLSDAGHVLDAVKALSAPLAFRKFSLINMAPIPNAAGDFRGIVANSKFAAVFHFADRVGGPLDNALVVASLAINLANASGEINGILQSNEPWNLKGAQMLTQVSSVCLRTVLGGVPQGAHLLALGLRAYLQAGNMRAVPGAAQLNNNIASLDASFSGWFNTATDGNNMYMTITKYFPPGWISQML